MAIGRRRTDRADWTPKPWHRLVGAVVVAGAVAAAVVILLDVDAEVRTSWAKHVTGAAAVLFVVGGVAGAVAVPRVTVAVLAVAGWTFPVSLAWLGVEHWVDWYAFYNATSGKGRITSEPKARVVGGFYIAFALGLFWFWTFLLRGTIEERRTASADVTRRSSGPTGAGAARRGGRRAGRRRRR